MTSRSLTTALKQSFSLLRIPGQRLGIRYIKDIIHDEELKNILRLLVTELRLPNGTGSQFL